jgi:hypothetical protein
MSAGVFQLSRYQSDVTTRIYPVRVQPETLSATIASVANAAPAGAATEQGRLRVSAGRKTAGVRPRKVSLAWTATPPAGYKAGAVVRIVAMTPAFYAACVIGATGTYLGVAVQVVGRSPELT